jgi:hypothetical protein
VPVETANPIKLGILGYQHNKPFNQAVNDWRAILFPQGAEAVFAFPHGAGSTFKFKVRRSPAFSEIGLPDGGPVLKLPDSLKPLLKYCGIQVPEPELLFSSKAGTGFVRSAHPIRGLVENRPFDYPLTAQGFMPSIRLGVICPAGETQPLRAYLHNANRPLAPTPNERDYLVDFPGFQAAYGLPLELPEPGAPGWFVCPEPTSADPQTSALELTGHINRGVETLQSSYGPHVVLIFYPSRWKNFRGYRTEAERFDVHDFVKAFCVQRGMATQFLEQDTHRDRPDRRAAPALRGHLLRLSAVYLGAGRDSKAARRIARCHSAACGRWLRCRRAALAPAYPGHESSCILKSPTNPMSDGDLEGKLRAAAFDRPSPISAASAIASASRCRYDPLLTPRN